MKYFAYCRKSSEGEERQALSIPAQIDEIKRVFDDAPDMEITEWFEEKMSAKAPGRPVYADLIKRIEKGEADGIVAWHPDRLARNSVDGGWIIHLLDRRVLKDLKFVSYSYEHSPQGMFMLQIMFGQSKYYVDSLAVNVKRGMRKKIEMGWLPNLAPLGYRNDRATGTIMRDPERFSLLQQAWRMLLTRAYTVAQIRRTLNEEWGFRTPMRPKTGGRPIAQSTLYKIFGSPFYAGVLDWYDEWRPGKHEPMVTLSEFKQAQAILGGPGRIKPETHTFAFTGLIHCSCGLRLTAEEKTKPSGRRYVYYHCTRSRSPRCDQPAIRAEAIEEYVSAVLRQMQLPERVELLLSSKLEAGGVESQDRNRDIADSVKRALEKTRQELRTLTELRIRGLLDDGEFVDQRQMLQKQEFELRESEHRLQAKDNITLELAQSVILFRKYAADWFLAGKLDDKRLILQTMASNPVLSDRKLSIQAKIPFAQIEKPVDCLYWLATMEKMGTDPTRDDEVHELINAIDVLKQRAEGRRCMAV